MPFAGQMQGGSSFWSPALITDNVVTLLSERVVDEVPDPHASYFQPSVVEG
jgi:hypothetical protein